MASNAVLNSSDVAPSATLRAELKEWERAFAAENGGRKAGRNDIKQNPSIGIDMNVFSSLNRQQLILIPYHSWQI